MADSLVFPIQFDLDNAVKQGSKAWKEKYAAELEKALQAKKVTVGVKFDVKGADALDKVKQRLKDLKLEPITPETKSAIRELAKELQTLAKALEKVQSLNTRRRVVTNSEKVNDAMVRTETQKYNTELEKTRAAAARAEAAELRLAKAKERGAKASSSYSSAIRKQSAEYGNQLSYIDRLIQRMAVLWSLSAVSNFLTKVREITAEFELQKVSLGAIIQDQARANALFSEIKSFALKSPLTIMDLTKYTKQLAAYRIETDELFETTKRLADVSVGLGVSFDRIILAYGQTKAASVLKASELRQYTEAGIPMLELLAEKFSELQGRIVSTGEVMDLISKRAVSFEMVKEIFEDMTDAGGMFYNLQEKQSQTLYGMWSKLGDAAAVMYDEIGKSEAVNSAMKGTIGLLETLMKNWRGVGIAIGGVVAAIGHYITMQKVAAIKEQRAAALAKMRAAQDAYNAAIAREAANLRSLDPVVRNNARAEIARANAIRQAASAELTAARNMTVLKTAINGVKTALATFAPTLAFVAAGIAAGWIWEYIRGLNKLKEALDDIKSEGKNEGLQSVNNFERLAKKVVEAADGTKEQKDALDELHRTYKDMIPVQDMTIEKLRALKGNYESLTEAVRQYIAQRTLEKGLNAIVENYGDKLKDARKETDKIFSGYFTYIREFKDQAGNRNRVAEQIRFSDIIDSGQFSKVKSKVEELARDTSKSYFEIWKEALGEVMEVTPYVEQAIKTMFVTSQGAATKLIDITREMVSEENKLTKELEEQTGYAGQYKKEWEDLQKAMQNVVVHGTSGEVLDPSKSFLASQAKLNTNITQMADAMKAKLKEAGVKIEDGWFTIVKTVEKGKENVISQIDFDAIYKGMGTNFPALKKYFGAIREVYEKGMPSDQTIKSLRAGFINLANTSNIKLDDVKRGLMNSGENFEDYRKRVKDSLKDIETEIARYAAIMTALEQKGMPEWTAEFQNAKKNKEAQEQLKAFYEEWLKILGVTDTTSSGRGSQSDPRLQNLQEIVSTLKSINKEYEDLAKKEGNAKALADTQKIYADTFKNIQALSKKYKFGLPEFDVPTDTKSLTDYLKKIKDVMAKLPKSDKAVLALQVDIDKATIDDAQKKIEKQLAQLKEKVERTKTAKEFYDKILNLTGDYDMSANITMSIYGDAGDTLQKDMAEQIRQMFGQYQVEVPVEVIGDDDTIDFVKLQKHIDDNREALGDMAKELDNIAKQGMQNSAKQYEQWLKDLEKAKSYSDKRIELARYTAKQISDIEAKRIAAQKELATGDISEEERKRLQALVEQYQQMQAGYREREEKQAATLSYEAFKEMPMYVQMFDNLDNASSRMLTNMRQKLIAMQGEWKNLSPTQLKELQSRLKEIDAQLAKRNPFKMLANSFKEWKKLREQGTKKQAEKDLQEKANAYLAAKEELDKAIKEHGEDSQEVKNAKQLVDSTGEAAEEAEKLADKWKKVEDAIGLSANEIFAVLGSFSDVAKGIADVMEALGGDEDDVQYWNDIADGLNNVAGGIQDILKSVMQGNVTGIVTNALTAIPKMIVGFSQIFNAGKVRKANKEIKRQQELIDQLSYSYSRLEDAQKRALGSDYISNYQQRIKNLQAQAEAYRKQYEAEQSKGKKKDEAKLKEYENSYRDTLDNIKGMQSELQEYFLGTDITSIAREWAKSWFEAEASFGSTMDAMKEKFADMMQNMIVEAMAAKIMEQALKPFYDAIDDAAADDFISASEIEEAARKGEQALYTANNAMEVLVNQLDKAGVKWQSYFGDKESNLTGIKRGIAEASEESITGLAQNMITQNFYISQIHANVAEMLGIMRMGYTPMVEEEGVSLTDLVAIQNEHLASLPRIEANTYATVERCERAAIACEEMATQLGRVIKPRGTRAAFSLSAEIA